MEAQQRAQLRRGVRFYNEMNQEYLKAISNIEKEIRSWYARYATANGMTISDARKLLTAAELSVFRMSVEDYIKLGEANALNPIYMKQLEAASVKAHITRLEALQSQMVAEAQLVYAKELNGLADLSKRIYSTGYYKTAYEIQRGAGVGRTIQKLDPKKIERVVSKPWTSDGKTFSTRIWEQQESLIGELKKEMSQMLMRGEAPDRAISQIAKKFNTSKANAGRLIMTESAHFASESQKDAFNELGVQEYEWVATLEEKTCEYCGGLDGKTFPMSEFVSGVTAPPAHTHCRCATVPSFKDMDDWGATRLARDEEGQLYEVPAEMTYKEWVGEFVEKEKPTKSTEVVLDNLDYVKSINDIYRKWDKSSIRSFEKQIMNEFGLTMPLHIRDSGASTMGRCRTSVNKTTGEVSVSYIELNSKDIRNQNHKVKTALHETFHARQNGIKSDYINMWSNQWEELEETFSEASALYLSKELTGEFLAPSYGGHLIHNLPKLKSFEEFKDCVTVTDFGRVSSMFRFGKTPTAEWKKFSSIFAEKSNVFDYAKPYMKYLNNQKEYVLNVIYDNYPDVSKSQISGLYDSAISKYDGDKIPTVMSANEKTVFEMAVTIAMESEGVR